MASLFNSNYTENIIVKPSGIVNSNTKDELNTECCTLPVIILENTSRQILFICIYKTNLSYEGG